MARSEGAHYCGLTWAPSRAIARDLASGIVEDYGKDLPTTVACFKDDFEARDSRTCACPSPIAGRSGPPIS